MKGTPTFNLRFASDSLNGVTQGFSNFMNIPTKWFVAGQVPGAGAPRNSPPPFFLCPPQSDSEKEHR